MKHENNKRHTKMKLLEAPRDPGDKLGVQRERSIGSGASKSAKSRENSARKSDKAKSRDGSADNAKMARPKTKRALNTTRTSDSNSLNSSFLNKLVYDYKETIDGISANNTIKRVQEDTVSRKSEKSQKFQSKSQNSFALNNSNTNYNSNSEPSKLISESVSYMDDKNESRQKNSLMSILTMSKTSLTSLREPKSNDTVDTLDRARINSTTSLNRKSSTDEDLKSMIKSSNSLRSISVNAKKTSSDEEATKPTRSVVIHAAPVEKSRSVSPKKKPVIRSNTRVLRSAKSTNNLTKSFDNDTSSSTLVKKTTLRPEDYFKSIERLTKSARDYQKFGPTKYSTIHDDVKLDSESLFALNNRLALRKN